ncbi:MAG: FAD-linked oxidase C-terminal domain-containing protein [Bacteroidota bacterium]
MKIREEISQLDLAGELYTDELHRRIYATDASAYRELPLAVAVPKTESDIEKLIAFARKHRTSLIPRTAGTSLAGQVVGKGIVVDVSRYFNKVLEINKEEKWVRVQPGVIRDDLNRILAKEGLFFGPETSTANRAMIGGMIGNNSCGANSVVYGSARDHLLESKGYISDGSKVEFSPLDDEQFMAKVKGADVSGPLEKNIYSDIYDILSDTQNRENIAAEFPSKNIPRRNTGYAIDILSNLQPFEQTGEPFNFNKLIAGSEGTLFFLTEAKLSLNDLPPENKKLVCIHCESIDESLKANLVALQFQPYAVELMDHYILECTKANREQNANRFFVKGDPKAILVVELAHDDDDQLQQATDELIDELKQRQLGYHYPVVSGDDIKRVWNLRKAGLGLLSNIPGDAKPAPVIEDTAVDVKDLPDYIRDFNGILEKHGLYSVHYAHAGSGELHLRPILNLKTSEGHRLFRVIAEEIATLVKKYNGSLSGEHGDGRLRGEFIRQMIGDENYRLIERVKRVWDPEDIFNPGKIVDTPPMDQNLRYRKDQETPDISTYFRYEKEQGVVRAAELCNGSGDCRKSALTGGTMCPSFMATGNEKDTTRARANMLREMLTQSDKQVGNAFNHEEIKEAMDLCLSCKGCKSECPSNVDMAKLKAEFLQNYYDVNGAPFRAKKFADFTGGMKLAEKIPGIYNTLVGNSFTASIFKSVMGIAPQRDVPKIASKTLQKWYRTVFRRTVSEKSAKGKVYFFCDEFTNYQDAEIGIKAIELMDKLGYWVEIPEHLESGRTWLSKGFLKEAKAIIDQNIRLLSSVVSEQTPIVGLEPSAILSFRDEYLSLCDPELTDLAAEISKSAWLIEEFIVKEFKAGKIDKELFDQDDKIIRLHGHCHQKALASVTPTKQMLQIPQNYTVQMIPSGCCGMAGSFGYEKEHYQVSMDIGELVLFPTVRQQPEEVLIAAPGTSCRHQIKDGTGRAALHPVEILHVALK